MSMIPPIIVTRLTQKASLRECERQLELFQVDPNLVIICLGMQKCFL